MADEHTEGELALKKRRDFNKGGEGGLDDTDVELLDQNKLEREQILLEINELRERNERRKKEREEEERRLAAERSAEEARRKAEEEERKRKKEEDEIRRKNERALKLAEFEKWKNPPKANFVISKKIGAALGSEPEAEQDDQKNRKSKEQLESEKRAILAQRIKPLEVSGMDASKLAEKAKELHSLIARLEGEKYDLEKRYKTMQVQLMELADRARQQNQVGKEGGLKRIHGTETPSILSRQDSLVHLPRSRCTASTRGRRTSVLMSTVKSSTRALNSRPPLNESSPTKASVGMKRAFRHTQVLLNKHSSLKMPST